MTRGQPMNQTERQIIECLQDGYEIRVPLNGKALYLYHHKGKKHAPFNVSLHFFMLLNTANIIERVPSRGKQNYEAYGLRKRV